jgi:hypothetical protein
MVQLQTVLVVITLLYTVPLNNGQPVTKAVVQLPPTNELKITQHCNCCVGEPGCNYTNKYDINPVIADDKQKLPISTYLCMRTLPTKANDPQTSVWIAQYLPNANGVETLTGTGIQVTVSPGESIGDVCLTGNRTSPPFKQEEAYCKFQVCVQGTPIPPPPVKPPPPRIINPPPKPQVYTLYCYYYDCQPALELEGVCQWQAACQAECPEGENVQLCIAFYCGTDSYGAVVEGLCSAEVAANPVCVCD